MKEFGIQRFICKLRHHIVRLKRLACPQNFALIRQSFNGETIPQIEPFAGVRDIAGVLWVLDAEWRRAEKASRDRA